MSIEKKQLYDLATVSDLINDFRETTEHSDAFVYNSHLDPFQTERDFQEADYIILGDFPGEPETGQGMYFAGDTGRELLGELERLLLNDEEDARHKFLILNKTFMSKSVSDDLLPDDAAKKAQEYMATLAYCCYQKINGERVEEDQCQIWTFGDDYKVEYQYFYRQLAEEFAGSEEENVYVFPHPLYGNLYESITGEETILDLLDSTKQQWQKIKLTFNT